MNNYLGIKSDYRKRVQGYLINLLNPRQKAYRKAYPMKSGDVLNSRLLQNPVNPKVLLERLVLGRAIRRITYFLGKKWLSFP